MSIILDSNLLLILVVGLASRDYIAVHRRLRAYSIEDFVLLQSLFENSARTRGIVSLSSIKTHLVASPINSQTGTQKVLATADKIVVTPNILTETSNLAGYISEPARTHIYMRLKALVEEAIEEQYVKSKLVVARDEFSRVELTDAAILEMATPAHTLLTVDLDLYLTALNRGLKAENFTHRQDL